MEHKINININMKKFYGFTTKIKYIKPKYFQNFCSEKKIIGDLAYHLQYNYGFYDSNVVNDYINELTNKWPKYNYLKNVPHSELIENLDRIIHSSLNHTDTNIKTKKQIIDEIDYSLTTIELDEWWMKHGHIVKLKKHYSLQYCAWICKGGSRIKFKKIPQLTDKHTLESCYVVNYNSLSIIRDFDLNILEIAEELLAFTYTLSHTIKKNKNENNSNVTNISDTYTKKSVNPISTNKVYGFDRFEKLVVDFDARIYNLYEQDIITSIDSNYIVMYDFWLECLTESEIENITTALRNITQTFKTCKSFLV